MMILDSGLLFWATLYMQSGPKIVSHFRIINIELLNRIKACQRN